MNVDPAASQPLPSRLREPFISKGRLAVAVLVLGLWFSSLFVPAAHFVDFPKPIMGYEILLLGWLGVLNLQPAWLANIGFLLLIPIYLIEEKPRGCTFVGANLVTLFAITALFWHEGVRNGQSLEPIVWGTGFYLWISAMFGMALAAFIRLRAQKKI